MCFTSPSSCCDCNIVVFPFYYSIPANWQPYWLLHIQIEAATGFPLMSYASTVPCAQKLVKTPARRFLLIGWVVGHQETRQNTRSPIPFDWLSCGSSCPTFETRQRLAGAFVYVGVWCYDVRILQNTEGTPILAAGAPIKAAEFVYSRPLSCWPP